MPVTSALGSPSRRQESFSATSESFIERAPKIVMSESRTKRREGGNEGGRGREEQRAVWRSSRMGTGERPPPGAFFLSGCKLRPARRGLGSKTKEKSGM